MNHRDHFIAALDANPSDQVTRAIFADWLEEQGELVLAAGLRWMVTNGKWPARCILGLWGWYWLVEYDEEYCLGGLGIDVFPFKRTRQEAEIALSEALTHGGSK